MLLAIRMKPCQKFIYGQGRPEHIHTNDCRPMALHTGNITIFHLTIMGSRIISRQTGCGNLLHSEKLPAY